jgi:nitrosocyanin
MGSSGHRYLALLIVVGGAFLLPACGEETDERSISAAVVDGKPGFDPETLRVHEGRKVDLSVGNTTDKTHGFSIDGYDVARTVDVGKSEKVEFEAGKGGEFRIFCQLHPAHQAAKLVVE